MAIIIILILLVIICLLISELVKQGEYVSILEDELTDATDEIHKLQGQNQEKSSELANAKELIESQDSELERLVVELYNIKQKKK